MKKETLRKVKGIRKIGDEFFVPEETEPVTDERAVPIYLAITRRKIVYPDSPVIGGFEYGEPANSIHGPFFSEQEANAKIQAESKQTDHSHYYFTSKVTTTLLKPEQILDDNLPKLFRYYKNKFCLSFGEREYLSEALRRSPLAITPEKLANFSQILEKRFRECAKELKEVDGKLVAIIEHERIFFAEMTPTAEGFPWFIYECFSEKPTPESFLAELSHCQIDPHADPTARSPVSPSYQYASFSPVEFSLKYNSIDDLIKSNGLIH